MNVNTISAPKSLSRKTTWTTRELCLTAVMTALVFLATFVPRIPIPLGYAHLGDAAIFLMVLLLPKRPAFFAACIGSALSDLLGGFPLWILPTLLIKFIMGWIALRLADKGKNPIRTALAFLAASLWMTAGYTAFGALLYDSFSAGLASAPGLLAEGIVNTLAALAVLPILKKALHS